MARLSLTLIILGIGFISSTLSDDVTLSPTTETAEAAAVGSSGSSILESTSVPSQERDDPPKGMDGMSHNNIIKHVIDFKILICLCIFSLVLCLQFSR